MTEENSERRAFPRYPMDFVLEVLTENKDGASNVEKTTLIDLSSSGAKFVTVHPDWYLVNQKLYITTFLPGGDDLKAYMKGTAIVQWITTSKGDGGQSLWEVGISIDSPLGFERSESKEPAT